MRRRTLASVLVALLLVTTGCVGTGGTASSTPTATDGTPTPTATPGPTDGPQSTVAIDGAAPTRDAPFRSYERLYDRTIDSVVEIRVRTPSGGSQGSGFVYDEAGYIVTNQHVVGQADTVQVRFRTGEWRTARVVGTDVYTDLAVVKVQSLPQGIDALPIARTDPEPGQPVVALGSPLGYEGTITHGIISGVNRSMRTRLGFSIPDTIQTDAAINPGNSGGPLVTTNGTVIGVNRAKQGDNIGFAISADILRQVIPTLARTGEYHHSFLGIRTVQMTPVIADANGLSSARGVMVVGVLDGGPAAGELQPATLERTDAGYTVPVNGDIIVRVDDRRIRSQQDLAQYLMLHTRPGERVTVTVLRDGQRVTETITLGRRPELSVSRSV